jgi:uncharacterized protein (DUF736 family)
VHAGRWRCRLDAIEAALARLRDPRRMIMATIGSFTRDDSSVFTGTIRTLTLNVKASIRPATKDNDKAPDYRVMNSGNVEFGAGWTKTSREDRPYVSVKLDDPSLPAPIYATLVEGEHGTHNLIWSR